MSEEEKFSQELLDLSVKYCKSGLDPRTVASLIIGFGVGAGLSVGMTRDLCQVAFNAAASKDVN